MVAIKRYKYDAIPLSRYQLSISDICIGKSDMKMPFLYRFDIDIAMCQPDIAADLETTKIWLNSVAETTPFYVG